MPAKGSEVRAHADDVDREMGAADLALPQCRALPCASPTTTLLTPQPALGVLSLTSAKRETCCNAYFPF